MKGINRALFLDLDGTVIKTKSGQKFPKDKYDWVFNKNILQQIDRYVDEGFFVMIVSNQGGIESGVVKLNDFREKMRRIINDIIVHTGIPLAHIGYRFAISNNPSDYFRKPNAGMAYDLALSYILDLSKSLMVGDASGLYRETKNLIRSGPEYNWYYEGTNTMVSIDVLTHKSNRLVVRDAYIGYLKIFDFADSDYEFARSAGIPYMDIEEFLTKSHINETSATNRDSGTEVNVPSTNIPGH